MNNSNDKFYRLRINDEAEADDPANYAVGWWPSIFAAMSAVRAEFGRVGGNNGIPRSWPSAPRDGEHVLS